MRTKNSFLYILSTLLLGFFIIGAGMLTTAEAATNFGFVKKLVKKDKAELAKIAKGIDTSTTRKMLSDNALSKQLDIPAHMITPAVRKLAMVGEEIVNNGKFASNFLNKSSMPEEVIRQYSRYGKDNYLKMAQATQKAMGKETKSEITMVLEKLKEKYKSLNEVINKYNAGDYDGDIMVRTLKKTGKKGAEALGWLADHPKTAMAGAATAWYLYDPEGFEEAMTKSGQKIASFVGETMVNAAGGVGEGIASGLSKATDKHSIGAIIGGAVAILIVLLLFLGKTFRRILLFPFTFLGIKLNKKMTQTEAEAQQKNPSHQPTADQLQQPTEQSSKREPRSNL